MESASTKRTEYVVEWSYIILHLVTKTYIYSVNAWVH